MTTLATPSVILPTKRLRRQAHDDTFPRMSTTLQNQWWSGSSSDGSTFLPTQTSSSSVTPSSPSANPSAIPSSSRLSATAPTGSSTPTSSTLASATTSGVVLTSDLTTFTSSLPITVSDPSTTFTSYSLTTITSSRVFTAASDSETAHVVALVQPVCVGDGVDAYSWGLLAAVVVPSVIGLLIWLLFAILRPRYRQVYGLREWFVQQGLRPKPLGPSFWAFLFPHVPLVPSLPSDVSDAGRSPAKDAVLFPSDEQLSQRVLWVCTLIAAGWTLLALAGFLPLYMVSTPCLADSVPKPHFTGAYSALQDLSLLRLLRLYDAGQVTTADARGVNSLSRRAVVDGRDRTHDARIRIIIATVLAIVLGLLPVLWKILKEFSRLVAYRERWMDVRCQGLEMGWLSARHAPGFVGWGEQRLKDYLVKIGLSSSLDANDRNARSRRRRRAQEANLEERGAYEIDIQSLFSIGDTGHLALLIDERDEILENLEVAETKYINSFRLTTPDPSIADWEPPVPPPKDEPEAPTRPQISRPLPLSSSASRRRRRRGRNPAYASSSLPPTSYVMPSQFYKITDLGGITGGEFADPEKDLPSSSSRRSRQSSFTESVSRRIVGSRFQEVNRNSTALGRLPIGSQLVVDHSGALSPMTGSHDSPVIEPAHYGPDQHTSWDTTAFRDGGAPHDQQQWYQPSQHEWPEVIPEDEEPGLEPEEDWHDVAQEDPEAFQHAEEYPTEARRRPRPPRARTGAGTPIEEHRETFPMRHRGPPNAPEEVPPPHLRLQPRQPFVRPLSGLDHDQLGRIYADINHWRWKLKVINTEIAEVQRECYNDIADGARIKGWLLIGRGLRYLPGVQLIEGRAKEDIRWDELQYQGDWTRSMMWWLAVIMVGLMLGIGLTAASGLAVATAPDVAHYFPFLMPLVTGSKLGGGVGSTWAASLAATLFIFLALAILRQLAPLTRTVSLSASRFIMFKTMFWFLLIVGSAWMFTTGAILFSIQAFSSDSAESQSVANGAVYMSAFALVLVLNVAIIFPGLLLLQPIRLLNVIRAEKAAVTPRQRFRAVYPIPCDPFYATSCSVLALIFASAFALIFPLLAPAVLLLLFLTLIAHRFLVGYVYGRTLSQTGGLLYLWLLRRLGTALAFQPLILGLIFLSRRLWIEGGVLCGAAFLVSVIAESFCEWRMGLPGRRSLSPITLDSLATFERSAMPGKQRNVDEEGTSLVSSARNTRARGSFASVLEMMSLTLAVTPSASETRGPVPLDTENLDDLTATERAARTNPDAPPHLPPLPFADHAEEMAGVLYAPELLAPPPMIWLPNDVGGIGRSEAYDLQRYHNLPVTLDVRAKEDPHSPHVL
ncbi:hypothetical protein BN946_scf184935.g13 [Trametes cinnabarina]|uniref:CSC1/OSCA1-like 7TM region domain-containing protein n=1 Tax=Pycnoporus cinnabarinus TaxID=5643 RepID=A0A060SLT0_PYCCI|nr:hypothetical protein BN946_scf184935.g13 [Trametes cinnabarina]